MFLLLFLNYWFILLIPAVISHILNPIEKLVIPIGIPTKEAKKEIKMQPVMVEIKISQCAI